jgi:hypothetical protein
MTKRGLKTMTFRTAILSGAVMSLALSPAPLRASDITGIYAIVEKVVPEPNTAEPLRIQVWGAFAFSTGQPGNDYQPPRRGYLYYSCPAGKEATCRREWADLRSVAGTGTAVGFGGRYTPTGRLRLSTEPVGNPDVYPIQMGVSKLGPNAAGGDDIQTKLQEALRRP